MKTNAIHHVTAISGPAQRNVDFYVRTLGLRLVKRTVNFDDPGTWHLYFGDAAGRPGTIMTFFPWADAAPARFGTGETHETAFRVPAASIDDWTGRLAEAGVDFDMPVERFGERTLAFRDPDGTRLALVGSAEARTADGAVDGFHGVTLVVAEPSRTARILTDVLGFVPDGEADGRLRFRAPGAEIGSVVDLRRATDLTRGRLGAGTVHHVAFRAADDADQAAMVRRLAEDHGLRTTEQRDRNYFRSVYFREPGGVLFEIATDDPGFAVDEPAETLGTTLRLPAFLEPRRAEIEANLPDIR